MQGKGCYFDIITLIPCFLLLVIPPFCHLLTWPYLQVEHPGSGRWLECLTDQPGCQFYTANFVPTDDRCRRKGWKWHEMMEWIIE